MTRDLGHPILLATALAGALGCGLPTATTSTAGDDPADMPTSAIGGVNPDGGHDPFGVIRLYKTAPGGREWYLPSNADVVSSEWDPLTDDVSKVANGVFHTDGTSGEVRLEVVSPSGKAWWRDVEMTGYFRYTGDVTTEGQLPHFEFMVRNEDHYEKTVSGTSINAGVVAPPGTPTWPGYPYGSAQVNGHCLGSSYHGNFYPKDGQVLFEKEVTHMEGYASQKGAQPIPGWSSPLNHWFGMKLVAQNSADSSRIHLEIWVDANANGNWVKVTEFDDQAGTWPAKNADLDGCTAAPFNYTPGMLLSWAGPWATFRSDSMAIDFKWLSIREIGPVP